MKTVCHRNDFGVYICFPIQYINVGEQNQEYLLSNQLLPEEYGLVRSL